ncbi:MAG: YggS family pyridoxal phosphate-dependent enzyme [Pseudobdellovibrionaceae bacterium]
MSQVHFRKSDLPVRVTQLEKRISDACLKKKRSRAEIQLVAVSKLQPSSAVKEAWLLGQKVFGENYLQEANGKKAVLSDLAIEWHFIGHLQSNKAKQVVGNFSLIHSVDSLKLVQALDRLAKDKNLIQKILIEVNLAGEQSKSGLSKEQCAELIAKAAEFPNLKFCGLMSLPPLGPSPESSRPYFRELRELRTKCIFLLPDHLQNYFIHLSMGTTGDFEVAIEEGATLIRVGTAYFGERESP